MRSNKTKVILTGLTLALALGCQAKAPAPDTTK